MNAGRIVGGAVEGPGDDGSVAHIVVYRPPIAQHRVGNRREQPAEIFLHPEVAVFLGVAGRAGEVDEQEDALFLNRIAVTARQQAQKDIAA
ncbi:hypothetical protein D9M70_408830 [compost metagenome]